MLWGNRYKSSNLQLYNSPQVTLSSFKDKSIIHNQDEGYGANKDKIAVYYDNGFNDLGLNYENSVNCYLSNGKILITEKGSVDDWKPYIIFNNVNMILMSQIIFYLLNMLIINYLLQVNRMRKLLL